MLTVGFSGGGARGDRLGAVPAAERLQHLREALARYRHERRGARKVLPTGLAPLDAALPGGGLPAGAVTEILSDGLGMGALTLALRIARGACLHAARGMAGLHAAQPRVGMGFSGEPACLPVAARRESMPPLILVDTCIDFYPPAALALGIDLHRLWVIRPRCAIDAFWAMDQSLRCSAVAAVVAPLEKLDERASRRLQLSAEAGGGLGLLLRSVPDKSFAAVRIRVEPVAPPLPALNAGLPAYESSAVKGPQPRLVKLSLIKVREGMPVEPFLVDLNHETGDVPLLPASVDRPAPQPLRIRSA